METQQIKVNKPMVERSSLKVVKSEPAAIISNKILVKRYPTVLMPPQPQGYIKAKKFDFL